MDQRPNGVTRSRFLASVDRICARMWPIGILAVAIVVAACGNGNGGGPGY